MFKKKFNVPLVNSFGSKKSVGVVPPLTSTARVKDNKLEKTGGPVENLEKATDDKVLFSDKERASELFVFHRTLGVGTFGNVRLATFRKHLLPANDKQRTIPTLVAIKVMEKALVIKSKQVDHINNERSILLQLRHPFLVNTFGTFQDKSSLYLILEVVQGGEFFFFLRKSNRLSNKEARFYAAQICDAFEYLHGNNIIYRDLKPENVLIAKDGYLKLTDFGFAKYCDSRTYTLCGTPEYMAPEILLNKGHGKAVDWWTLGIFIYEMIVGRPPFCDEEPIGIYKKILQGVIIFPADIDKDAKLLIHKLLEPDLSKRWGNLARGVKDIKNCKWFTLINFQELRKKKLPVTYIPKIKDENDFSNFEHYAEHPMQHEHFHHGFNPFPEW